jgi:hypothetical protein
MFKKTAILILSLLIPALNGCGMYNYSEVKDADLVEVSYDATNELQYRLNRTLPKHSLIIVSTLLNVDNLNKTSAFGRIISDQIASAFHQAGYRVIGMEMPIDLFVMNEDGTLKLSDENKAMLKHYQAAVIVGGVYAPGKKNSYVSLRLVDLAAKNIVSSTDFSIPMGPDAKKLMEPKSVGSAGTRAPATDENAAAVTDGVTTPLSEGEKTQPEENNAVDSSLQ